MTIRRAIALILVVAALVVGVRYMLQLEGEDQSKLNNLYAEAEPLQRERDALIQERDNLELDYALLMRDVSTVQLLFRELDTALFTDIYPIMRDRGITGVLGLTYSEFPNYWGKITSEHFNRLMMDGWGSCYVYDVTEDLDYWLNYMEYNLNYYGITPPTAIYFVGNRYDDGYEEILRSHGIVTVVRDAADGHSNTVTDVMGEFWQTGAMPWNYTGVNNDLELLSHVNGGNICFTISFNNLWDSFEADSFTQMMDTWQSYLEVQELSSDQARVTPTPTPSTLSQEEQLEIPLLRSQNFEQALEGHRTATENNATLEKELTERREAMDARIATLEEQIRDIYARWQQGD